jgi:PAS domain S-box-containing protein
MNPAPDPIRRAGDDHSKLAHGRRWLRQDEGWTPGEEGARLLAAIAVSLLAIGAKALVNAGTTSDFGYLSFVTGVILAAWVAGASGGIVATFVCATAELLMFNPTAAESVPASGLASLRLILFVVNGAAIALIAARLRRVAMQDRTARATSQARLVEQQHAHAAAERDRAQLTRLQTVTASLTGAATPEEVATSIVDRGLAALGALAGVVLGLDDDGSDDGSGGGVALTVLASRGYPESLRPPANSYVPEPRSHVRQVLTEGRPLLLADSAEWAERFPDTPPISLPGSPDGGAIALLPLNVETRRVGLAIFRFAEARDFADGTGDLAVRLADQAAGALDRALARHQEHVSFQALQRAQVRLTFVVRVSELIGAGAGFPDGAASVPRAAVPELADWCAVGLLDGDRHIVATAGTSPAAERSIEHLAVQTSGDLGLVLTGAARANDPEVLVLDDGWARGLGNQRAAAVMAELGSRVVLIAPILSPSGDRLGSLVLGSAVPDQYGPDDLAMSRDVADRLAVAAERARLFTAVARFKATVDASADAIYMFDPDTLRITYVNRGGADLVALEPVEVQELELTTLLASTDEAGFRQRLADLRSTSGRALAYTDVITQRGGRQIPVDVLLQDVPLPDGSRTTVLTARDTSDRIDVQARLARIAGDERRQAAELRAVIQSMGDAILVVDPDGRISLANEAALTIFNASLPDRLADLERWLGVGVIDPPPVAQGGGAPESGVPVTVRLEDGRWLELSTYSADLAGTHLDESLPSRIVVLRDVTRVREAAAAQDAFLDVLSHELRTPITTIFGYAKVLQRPSHEDERETMLQHIEVESDRLYRIVEDLLALSRVERGITIEGEPLLVQYLVAPVISSEAPRWTGTTFETDLPPDLPVVMGERTYVEQVLRNLLSNAAKYSPPGTTVTVQAGPTLTEVVVRVLDRGPGIEEEEAERLFGLYYRSAATARKAAGAGIGLYISRGLIAAMGGRIWARPRDGGGSEFGFSLPRADEDLGGMDDSGN